MMYVVKSAHDGFRPWYDVPVTLFNRERLFGHMTDTDASLFVCLNAMRSKGPIIEFGTFTGRTAYDMAINSTESVYTIDAGYQPDSGYPEYVPGSDFEVCQVNKPHLLLGDSRTVAIPVEPHTAGFIFIDGGHDYETVKSDSERAFELIRPDGVILWDDCNEAWPGVCQYIRELSETRHLLHIKRENQVAWGLLPWR